MQGQTGRDRHDAAAAGPMSRQHDGEASPWRGRRRSWSWIGRPVSGWLRDAPPAAPAATRPPRAKQARHRCGTSDGSGRSGSMCTTSPSMAIGCCVGTHEGLWVQCRGQPAQLVSDPPFDVMGLRAVWSTNARRPATPARARTCPPIWGCGSPPTTASPGPASRSRGEVDFHRLRAAGRCPPRAVRARRAAAALDRCRPHVDRPGHPAAVDLAVDPTDADQVVGTTEQGPVASADGGTSFDAHRGRAAAGAAQLDPEPPVRRHPRRHRSHVD